MSPAHSSDISALKKVTDKRKSFRQRAVLEFLKQEIHASDIHTQLKRVYGDACMGASSIRWCVKHFKYGNTDYADEPPYLPPANFHYREKQMKNRWEYQNRRATARKRQQKLEKSTTRSKRCWKVWNTEKLVPAEFLMCWRRSIKWKEKRNASSLWSGNKTPDHLMESHTSPIKIKS